MIAIIVAFPENRVIGKGLYMPWKIPGDLKHFKEQTLGKTVIMGSTTFKSIGKPLPHRQNIVLTRKNITIDGATVAHSVDEAIEQAQGDIFVMGGANVYKQFLPKADKLYISHIKEHYDGDVFFPEIDWEKWEKEYEEDKGEFVFRIYQCISK